MRLNGNCSSEGRKNGKIKTKNKKITTVTMTQHCRHRQHSTCKWFETQQIERSPFWWVCLCALNGNISCLLCVWSYVACIRKLNRFILCWNIKCEKFKDTKIVNMRKRQLQTTQTNQKKKIEKKTRGKKCSNSQTQCMPLFVAHIHINIYSTRKKHSTGKIVEQNVMHAKYCKVS